MNKIFRYLLISLIVLMPFSVSAINLKNIKGDEYKEDYYCTLLWTEDSNESFYDVFYTYRKFGATTKNVGEKASSIPTPRCIDSTYSAKESMLAGSNCFYDFYNTKVFVKDSSKINFSYNGWSTKISDTNRYFGSLNDCIAASVMTSGVCGENSCNENRESVYMEVKKNSDIYNEDEMNEFKNLYSGFNDDTEFCYASTLGSRGENLKVYFGHPMYYIDFSGVVGNIYDPLALIKEKDSNNKNIVNFSGIKTVTDSRQCGEVHDNEICASALPLASDSFITFDDLNKLPMGDQRRHHSFIIKDENGNLITDSKKCTGVAQEKSKNVGNYDVVDNTKEDENRPITSEDFAKKLYNGQSKRSAIHSCYYGDSDDGDYHCYRYTFLPIGHPMYNTTVWTKKKLQCGFELVKEWDWTQCKKSALDVVYKQCKTPDATKDNENPEPYCRNITHSGYNGVPDFYDERDSKDKDIECDNLHAFHIIYNAITIFAPIMTILFVIFDLIASIVSGDPKKVAKFRSKLTRRIIALVLLLVTPVLIYFLVNMMKNDAIKNTKYLKCVVLGNKTNKKNKTTGNNSNNGNSGNSGNSGNNNKSIVKTISNNNNNKTPTQNLVTNIIIDGVELSDFINTKKEYNLNYPSGKENVNIEVKLNTHEAVELAGVGINQLSDGLNRINIIVYVPGEDEELDDGLGNGYDNNLIEEPDEELDDGIGDDEDEDESLDVITDSVYDSYSILIDVSGDKNSPNNQTPKTPLTASEIKAKKSAFLASAKKLKKLTSVKNSKTFWCAKRCKNGKSKCPNKKDQKNPSCSTKKVENLYGNTQKYGKHVGGYSCASLVSFALYDSGLYTAYEVNHVANSSATRNINSANSMAKFLIAQGWTVVTKAKDLQPGDVIFEDRKGKPTVKVGGKKHHPGHVEIYKGKNKSYNTGGTKAQHSLENSYNVKTQDFGFALRFNGYK